MVDRDQTRRDVIEKCLLHGWEPPAGWKEAAAALLSELEQAEGLLHYSREATNAECERADEAVARLAKVPALVEAANDLISWDENAGNFDWSDSDYLATIQNLRDALAVWEQE